MEPIRVETQIAGRTLRLETGVLAKQATASVLVSYGETVVLCAATIADPRPGIDFFPLMVDYEEKFYATGKIKGSRFVKREGRPSDNAVLNSRLIDRPIRPLFPKGFRNEVQIVCTVLSADMEVPPATTALIGASAALALTGAPFEGPIGAVRIGLVNGELIVNPTYKQLEEGTLDFVVAGIREGIMMVEAGANEVSEELLVQAMELAQQAFIETIALQEQLVAKLQPVPLVFDSFVPGSETIKVDDQTFRLTDLKSQVADYVNEGMMDDVVFQPTKQASAIERKKLEKNVLEKFANTPEYPVSSIKEVIENLLRKHIRKSILEKGKRPDGRGLKDIRPISIIAGLLPRTHGSAVFQRGETQALSILTLGPKGDGQVLDEMDTDETNYFFHHYNFPPYSVGEVRPLRGAGRREIGHGHLAERAVFPMLPPVATFPYTMRIVSEILESNGSTSMAATCGSTLALMDAGVPLKRPVSGIAMGLMTDPESGRYAILSDIKDVEDFGGDMDFKIAGTSEGVTALQMDIKVKGLPLQVLRDALAQAKEGRAHILAEMLKALPAPRAEMSKYAPRVATLKIHPDQIRTLIGPGGKTIHEIQDTCGVQIDVEEDGTVLITSTNAEGSAKAVQWIEDMTSTLDLGEIFEGKVVKIVTDRATGKEIGVIVEKSKGKDGMVHISELDTQRVERIAQITKVGDTMKVKVLEVDKIRGRVSLSRKALLAPAAPRPVTPGTPPAQGYTAAPRPQAPAPQTPPPAPVPPAAPFGTRKPGLDIDDSDIS